METVLIEITDNIFTGRGIRIKTSGFKRDKSKRVERCSITMCHGDPVNRLNSKLYNGWYIAGTEIVDWDGLIAVKYMLELEVLEP